MKSFEQICEAFLNNGDVNDKNLVIILKEGFVTRVERGGENTKILRVIKGKSKEHIRVNCRYNVSIGGENLLDPELEFFRPANAIPHFYIKPSQISDYEMLE